MLSTSAVARARFEVRERTVSVAASVTRSGISPFISAAVDAATVAVGVMIATETPRPPVSPCASAIASLSLVAWTRTLLPGAPIDALLLTIA